MSREFQGVWFSISRFLRRVHVVVIAIAETLQRAHLQFVGCYPYPQFVSCCTDVFRAVLTLIEINYVLRHEVAEGVGPPTNGSTGVLQVGVSAGLNLFVEDFPHEQQYIMVVPFPALVETCTVLLVPNIHVVSP